MSYRLSDKDWQRLRLERADFVAKPQPNSSTVGFTPDNNYTMTTQYDRDATDLIPSSWGSNAKYKNDFYMQFGTQSWFGYINAPFFSWSPSFHLGYRLTRAYGKAYKLGAGLEWNVKNVNYATDKTNTIDRVIGLPTANYDVKRLQQNQLALELFQRVRFAAGGLAGNGIYWDFGPFVGWNFDNDYLVRQTVGAPTGTNKVNTEYSLTTPVSDYKFVWGINTRIVYDIIGIYGRLTLPYRFSKCDCTAEIPMLELGVQLGF